METRIFHNYLKENQATLLFELRSISPEKLCSYVKDQFSSILGQRQFNDIEKRITLSLVSTYSPSVYQTASTTPKEQVQWKSLPFRWKAGYCALSLLLVFIFSIIGAKQVSDKPDMSVFGAAILPLIGLFIGVSTSYIWARFKFGLGMAQPLTAASSITNVDAGDVYNHMVLIADAIDDILDIFSHEKSKESSYSNPLTTDILISMQKLLGSFRRDDDQNIIEDYIEGIEDALPTSGITVLHYSEENSQAFEMVSGNLHGIEIVPALANKNGIILPGKYMK